MYDLANDTSGDFDDRLKQRCTWIVPQTTRQRKIANGEERKKERKRAAAKAAGNSVPVSLHQRGIPISTPGPCMFKYFFNLWARDFARNLLFSRPFSEIYIQILLFHYFVSSFFSLPLKSVCRLSSLHKLKLMVGKALEIQLTMAWQPCWWNKQKKFWRNLLFMFTRHGARR